MPSETPKMQAEQSLKDAMDNARLEQLIRENTELTKSMHRVLMGEPEYKRAGLVEIVDRHEKIYVRGGAVFATAYAVWETIKFLHTH